MPYNAEEPAQMDLASRLREVGDRRRSDHALVFIDYQGRASTISWQDFAADVDATADLLRMRTSPGSVILCPASNRPDDIVRTAAVLASGRTLLPLNPESPASSHEWSAETIKRRGCRVEHVMRLLSAEHLTPLNDGPDDGVGPFSSGGYILETGGSTGLPKPLYHPGAPSYDARSVPSAVLRLAKWREYQTQLIPGPLHHAASFTRLVDGLLSGNTMVFTQIFSRSSVLEAITRFGVEWVQMTPAHMRILDPLLDRRLSDFSSVRAVLHTAAPCPAELKYHWIDRLGGERVFELYTSTEGIGATLCDGDEWMERPGTVGRGLFTRIHIADEDGVKIPNGTVGEVHMRSIQRTHLDFEAGHDRVPGYKSVGDRGYLDDDGYLFLCGRRADMIIVGGENVYSSEVESVILSHRGVVDAAVLGIEDELLGSRLCALVVGLQGETLSKRGITDHCFSRLAPYKVPSDVRFVASLPRTSAGKLNRDHLADLLVES